MNAPAGITIAIPNWNHEMLLPRAIASAMRSLAVLKERGIPAEVVAVDDCSRDGSLTLLRRLEARHYRDGFRLLAFETNGGLAANRNQMLERARYRYVTFLDADNELVAENLPYFYDTLQKTKAAVAYGNLLVRSVSADYAHSAVSSESVQSKLFLGNYIDAFALLDRLQILDAGAYDRSYQALEDWEMWIHLTTNGRKMIFLPMIYGYYYLLPSSMALDPSTEQASYKKIMRVFNQVRTRELLETKTRQLRYHPLLGYL